VVERSDGVIRASELSQYAYCAQAWWLGSVRGLPSAHVDQMEKGTAAHMGHGRRVRRVNRARCLAYGLLALAVLAGLAGLLGR